MIQYKRDLRGVKQMSKFIRKNSCKNNYKIGLSKKFYE